MTPSTYNIKTMSSREISELTNKEHRNVLADCDKLNTYYLKMGLAEISAGVYTLPSTGKQEHRLYQLTKIQTIDLMTGYNLELRIKINRRWEELENKQQFTIPSTLSEALRLAANQAEQIEAQQLLIESQKPKVLFADAVATSKNSILIGELAKIIKQNGIDIGQNRLFHYLRNSGYLISRFGSDYNMPTQKSMNLGLFEIKETPIVHAAGHITVNKTPKVTGKGQQYFVNHFLNREVA